MVVVGLGGWEVKRGYDQAIANGYAQTKTLTRSLAEHSERTFEAVLIVVDGLVDRIGRGALNDPKSLKAFLDKRSKAIKEAAALIVIDADGRWLVAGGQPAKAGLDSADREFFRRHRQDESRALRIGAPIPSQIDGSEIIPVSMRWNKPDGSFGGVALAYVETQYFNQFYEHVGLGQAGVISLLGDDRRFLVRHPQTPGRPLADMKPTPSLLDALKTSAEDQLRYVSTIDGVDRIAAYEHLKSYPLIVVAAESVDEILAAWRREALIQAGAVVLAVSLLMLLGIGAMRYGRRTDRAERALLESETRYRLLAENSNDMIVLSDLDSVRLYVSSASFELLGHRPEELIGTRPQAMVHPDEAQQLRGTLQRLCRAEIARATSTHRFRRKDGSFVWVEAQFRLVYDADAGRPSGFVSVVRDISERRRHEEMLKETTDLLSLSQEAAGAGSWDLDLRDGGLKLSVESAHLHGLHDPERVATLDDWNAIVDPDDAKRILDAVDQAVERKTTFSGDFRVKGEMGERWLSSIGRAYFDEEGRPVRMLGLNFDITERKLAEVQLVEANAAAEEARRLADIARQDAEKASFAKSDFLASMSHEIRTPLNGIIGYTDLLMDETSKGAPFRRKLEIIQESSAALLTIVNDILDFSKVEAGQIELDPAPFATRGLLGNVKSMLAGAAAGKGLTISVDVSDDTPDFVLGDESRLRQVLLNLANNAIKFSSEGRVHIVLDPLEADAVGADPAQDVVALHFSVQDTGIGISAAQQSRLFKRFSQVDGSITRRFGGTGLGLALCKQLVELMGGEIGVQSAEGEGSTFWFKVSLPRAAAPLLASEPSALCPTDANRARILLVEDVEVNQDLARAVLEKIGHTVEVASNGGEAVRMVLANAYDLVLMDVHMPVMDGIAATRAIRESNHLHSQVPIVAMTANVLPQQVTALKDAGMNDHVGKPFRRAQLEDVINRWIRLPPVSPGTPEEKPFDEDIARELQDAIGSEVFAKIVLSFSRDLVERFEGLSSVAPSRERLANDAHAMISAAGSLGFNALCSAFREMDHRCRTDADLVEVIERFSTARARALDDLSRLRERLSQTG